MLTLSKDDLVYGKKLLAVFETKERLAEYLLSRITKLPNGCWGWNGGHTYDGYSRYMTKEKGYFVHVLTYELFVGAVTERFGIRSQAREH